MQYTESVKKPPRIILYRRPALSFAQLSYSKYGYNLVFCVQQLGLGLEMGL
jgi:hypothetical protein